MDVNTLDDVCVFWFLFSQIMSKYVDAALILAPGWRDASFREKLWLEIWRDYNLVPSNVLSSTYFLGKTFFFSKIFLGDPPLIFLEVCLKFRSMERWSEKFHFHIARSPKKHFSAGVELRTIAPNFDT